MVELNKARDLAEKLLYKHGLTNYTIVFDNATQRFGCCKVNKQIISLSRPLTILNSEEVVKDIILHEIAHALDYKIHRNRGHGRTWKEICMDLGTSYERCFSDEVITPKPKYITFCRNCNYKSNSERKSTRIACGVCCRKYNNNKFTKEYLLTFKINN